MEENLQDIITRTPISFLHKIVLLKAKIKMSKYKYAHKEKGIETKSTGIQKWMGINVIYKINWFAIKI